jgi:hypothetical protein
MYLPSDLWLLYMDEMKKSTNRRVKVFQDVEIVRAASKGHLFSHINWIEPSVWLLVKGF